MRGVFNIIKAVLFVAIFLCFIFVGSPKPKAQRTSSIYQGGSIEKLKVIIEVQKDSRVRVEEIIEGLSISYPAFSWTIDSSDIKNLSVSENGNIIPTSALEVKKGDLSSIKIPLNYYSGTDVSISFTAGDILQLKNGSNFIKMIIFDSPILDIGSTEITLILPDDASDSIENQRIYAIHGIENAEINNQGPTQLLYKTGYAPSTSSLSIEDAFESSKISYPLGKKIGSLFSSMGNLALTLLALPLPIAALFILFYFDIRFRNSVKIRRYLKMLKNPPDNIPPALINLLYEGDITSSAISATILDLIKRGYLLVVDKGESITFGRKGSDKDLMNYEKRIMDELFKRQKIKTDISEVKKLQEKELIDPMFQKAYKEIYSLGSDKGYFTKNPYRTKILHHFIGILIFFLSILFLIFIIIFFPNKPLLILTPFSMTVASLLILYLAKIIPPRTPYGKQEIERWLGFKKFLLGYKSITDRENLAIDYLPYAEVLGATEEWIDHYRKLPTQVPSFYVSAAAYISTEEWMIKTINAAREVSIEIEELKGY